MNVALSTLLLIAFILPGYFVRYFYLTGPDWALNGSDSIKNSTSSINSPLAYEMLSILFFSLFIHLVAIQVTPVRDSYKLIFNAFLTDSLPSIGKIDGFMLYFIIICTLSVLLGFISCRLVRYFKLDIQYKFFRFNFHWFYLLSGECLAFPENGRQQMPDCTCVAATLEQNGKSYLYYGILGDYIVDASGKLKTLVLKKARRRELNNDSSSSNKHTERFYYIRGEWVMLEYENLKSLNIEYLYFESKENHVH